MKNESVDMSRGSTHKDFLAMLRSLNSIPRAIENLCAVLKVYSALRKIT